MLSSSFNLEHLDHYYVIWGPISYECLPFYEKIYTFSASFSWNRFSWGIPMAFSAQGGSLDATMWLLLVANWAWVIAYDTQYAMVDRDDDIKLGLKSTAIIFGKFSPIVIGILQFFSLSILIYLGESHRFGLIYQISVLGAGLCFFYQHILLSKATRENYFKAFLNNHWVGFIIFVGVCGNFFKFFPILFRQINNIRKKILGQRS